MQFVSPDHARSEARDSTLTQYIEVQSPLTDDSLLPSSVRYSTADSGVMSSSDVEQGPLLDTESSSNNCSHSVAYENDGVGEEEMQSGGFPYYTTTLPLSTAHHEHLPDSASDGSFYTAMMPHSILQQSRDSRSNDDITTHDVTGDDIMHNDVINNYVIDVITDDVIEGGVGTEMDFSTVMVEEIFLESGGQKSCSTPVYAAVKKRERKKKVVAGEGERQGEKEGGEKEEEKEVEKDGRRSKVQFGEKEDRKKEEIKRFEK